MTCPCPHSPHRSLDKRPCEPCAHCNAPAGIWCAPRCPRKPDRVGEPVEEAGPERWPAEWFQARVDEPARAELTFAVTGSGAHLGKICSAWERADEQYAVGVDPAEPGGDRTVVTRTPAMPDATPAPGHVYFAPAVRLVFFVVDVVRGSELRLMEVCGFRGARVDAAAPPAWAEDLGHPGALGPEGWMALRDGVLEAQDHAGRVEAVRTAAERAKEYGPAGRSR